MKERIIFIDVVKILAMVCVVGLHTTAGIPLLYSSCSIAIPLFFMATGYLMWDRKINIQYIAKKFFNIIRFIIIVNIVYWIIISFAHHTCDIRSFIKGLSIWGNSPFWQFWFLGSLLFVYAIFPLLQKNRESIKQILVVLFIVLQGVFVFNIVGVNGKPIESYIPQTFRLYNWLFFSILGGGIKLFLDKIPKVRIIHLIIALCINSIFQYFCTSCMNDIRCEFFYPSIVVIILCIMVFKYISQFDYREKRIKIYITEISKTFLPVFTVHIFLIRPVTELIRPYVGLLTSPLRWPIVLIISLVISYIIVNTKYLKNIFKI